MIFKQFFGKGFSRSSILHDFNAKDEDDLQNKLNKNWNIAKCCRCGKKLDLLKAKYIDGDPYHEGCVNGNDNCN
jgi:hypothetical protein